MGVDAPAEAPSIRVFAEPDEPAVAALWRRVFPDDPPRNEPTAVVRRKLATQRELFLVAVTGERIVGTVLAGYDGYRGWIYHLAVEPGLQRRGIGRRLVEEAERRLRARGCPKVNLQVRAGNRAVVALYEALGYSVETHVSMGKELGAK